MRWTRTRWRRLRSASASIATFSPLPEPSSTSVIGSARGPTISGAKRPRSRASARVMRYHGRCVIASKSDEPSAL
jgi:hypothetical protein